jgi:phosphomannomutase
MAKIQLSLMMRATTMTLESFDHLLARAEAWRQGDCDPEAAAELGALIDRAAQDGQGTPVEHELRERFSGPLEFGTAGLRGVIGAGESRMNRAVVRRATAGLARYLLANVTDVKQRGVIIGRDGRTLSPELADDTAGVLAAHGIPALFFPTVVPTPVTAFAVLHLKAAAAVMVTASHNPPEYNGYKVYWSNGAQIIPPHDTGIAAEIEKIGVARDVPVLSPGQARANSLWRDLDESVGRAYQAAIALEQRHPETRTRDFAIVYTAMHGVGGVWAKDALTRAGFTNLHMVKEQFEPDAAFPTVRFPNPEEKGALDLSLALADETRAELILANDPDADRLACVTRRKDGTMVTLTGNEVGVLLGHYVLTQTQPRPLYPSVMTSIVSSPQLGVIAHELGALYDEVLTGFKWIGNRAIEREEHDHATFLFGYEEALGYTVGDVARDKDGVGSALVFADLVAWCRSRGVTTHEYLEEIQRAHGLFVATQKNFTLPGAAGAATIAKIMDGFRASPPQAIGDFKIKVAKDYKTGAGLGHAKMPASNVIAYELEGGSRVTLRPSGTEPKIKYYFDLREALAASESLAVARARADMRLDALVSAFAKLAVERGQPS